MSEKKSEDKKETSEKHEHSHSGVHKHPVKTQENDNTWKIVAITLGILLVISLAWNFYGKSSGSGQLSAEEASKAAADFINKNILRGQATAKIENLTEKSGLYNMQLDISGRKFDSYITKDGKLLFPQVISLEETPKVEEPASQPQQPTLPKSDKPKVELFVMSYCPYGTQAEKGIIPVADLLKGKIDFDIKFVNYAMHGQKEVDEELRQYCIKTEQENLFFKYLKCFLKDGDSARCDAEAGIDKTKLTSCVAATDKKYRINAIMANQSSWGSKYPPFPIYADDNEKYGVGGSPTLVINGQEAGSGRNPAAYLAVICSSFNNAPDECKNQLESATPSPGFGYEKGSAIEASCS